MDTAHNSNRLKTLFPVYESVLSQDHLDKLIDRLKEKNCIKWKGRLTIWLNPFQHSGTYMAQ